MKASLHTLYVLDRVFFFALLWTYEKPTDTRIFSSAAVDFRIIQHLAYSPTGKKRKLLGHLERTFGTNRFSLIEALSHGARESSDSDFDNRAGNEWTDPFTGEVRKESFWDLYDHALANVPYALDVFFSPDFNLDTAKELTQNLNFDGQTLADEDSTE